MTYAQIAEWVASNYNLDNYDNVADLINEVKFRFESEQMYFPPEAGEEIKNIWLQEAGYEKQLSIEEAMQRRYEEAERELNQKIQNFFENAPPEYKESEVPYAEEAVEGRPFTPQQAPNEIKRAGGIRGFFGRIAKFFRRGT